jgi:F0F1-type ATP synthase assembly protein I
VEQRPTFGLWDLVTLGSVMLGCLVGGCGLGLLLDAHFGTLPVFTLTGLGVGIVSGAMVSVRRIRHYLS